MIVLLLQTTQLLPCACSKCFANLATLRGGHPDKLVLSFQRVAVLFWNLLSCTVNPEISAVKSSKSNFATFSLWFTSSLTVVKISSEPKSACSRTKTKHCHRTLPPFFLDGISVQFSKVLTLNESHPHKTFTAQC